MVYKLIYAESPHNGISKVLDCGVEVREFELQNVHLWRNTFQKVMIPHIPRSMS